MSVRVPVNTFELTRGFRRTLKINADVDATVVKSQATSEHYSLCRGYIDSRHSDGGMADMTVLDFSAMVDDNFVDSRLVEYRVHDVIDPNGRLLGAVLITMIRNGMNLMEVSQFKQMMAIGAVVIVAVWIDVVRRKHLLKK